MQIGDEFEGRYRILSELGKGGYATVWLGEHIKIGQKVAIKMTHEPGADPRFLREAKIMATLKNPHTVGIMDFGETAEGHAFIISEFIEGESLDELRRRGPLPAGEVQNVIEQTLESLAEAHQQGIIHRDIKPANLMRTPDGTIKVLDFGIARVTEKVDVGDLTASGIVLGTPRYLAPECLLSPESVTPAADIFALGLVAFALLTGEDANAGLSSRQIVARTLSNEPFMLPEALLVPSTLSRWVAVATTKRPDERFPNAMAALQAIRAADDSQTQVELSPLQTAPGTPNAIARPAADPTMNEDGALAFEAAAAWSPDAPTTPHRRRATKARERPEEPGVDIDHAVMSEISGERMRSAAADRDYRSGRTGEHAQPELDRREPPPRQAYDNPGIYRKRRKWGWLWFIILLAAAGGVAWKLGYIPLGEQRPNLGPIPDDPPHVVETYREGKLAFNEGRWQEALMHFNNLEQWPDTNSTRDMTRKDYIGRIIGDILQNSVDLRERAKTPEELDRAAEGPQTILEYYPQHEAALYVMQTLDAERSKRATQKTKEQKRRRKKKKEGEHPVWKTNRPPIDITFD